MSRTMSKVLSVLLSLMMFVTITVLPNKVEASDLLGDDNIKVKDEYIETDEKEIQVTEKTELITVESLNGMISIEDVEKYGHVAREVQNETSLNSMVMKNSDGTLTTYIFSEDIKYVDEFGNIKDKETSLGVVTDKTYAANYAYETTNNDVQVLFPRSLGEDSGVLLGKNDVSIELKPILSDHTVSRNVQIDNLSGSKTTFEPTKLQISGGDESYRLQDVVDYTNVFAVNTTLRYTPMLNGFKEDIVISEPNGVNEFTFSLKTNGMKFVEENNSYYLVDPETSMKKVSMGSLVVYDGDGIISNAGYSHQYEVSTVTENDEYLIKIIIDREYLEDESTIYPVTIDPSFEILSEENNIMDISVRANGIVYNDSVNNGVGHHNVLLEDMRAFIKFPGLLNYSLINDYAPPGMGYGQYATIQSIILQMYSRATSFDTCLVKVYSYNTAGAIDWNYNTTTFTTSQFNAKGNLWSSVSVPYGTQQWIDFDITNSIFEDSDNGIVLVNQFEGNGNDPVYQSFASTKDPTNKPRIVINWTGIENNSFDNAVELYLDASYNINISEPNEKEYYSFTPTTTGFYVFQSSNKSNGCDPRGGLYNSTQTQLILNDDGAGNLNYKIIYHLDSGVTYYIETGCFSTRTGTYSFMVSKCTNLSALSNVTTISMATSGTATISTPRERNVFSITPTITGSYTIESSVNSGDPRAWIYNSSGQLLTSNDDGGVNRNFKLNCSLTAGQKYYIVSGCYSNGTDNYKVSPVSKYKATVNNYFDNGYSVYIYENHSCSPEVINGYMDAVATRYFELFDLYVFRNNATYFESDIDLCKQNVSSNNIDTLCTHAGTIHTDRSNLISNFNNNVTGSNVITNILWSNHKIKSVTGGITYYNRSCSTGSMIFMLERCTESNRVFNSQAVLMHELNHQYGAPDHYHEIINGKCRSGDLCSTCGENARPITCIMNKGRVDIYNDDVLCEGCISNITTHLNSHH